MKRLIEFGRFFFSLLLCGTPLLSLHAEENSERQRVVLDEGWKFTLGDPAGAETSGFVDTAWREVTLPHDWSIEGSFDAKAPMGGGGGFLPAGIGWYRKKIDLPAPLHDRRMTLEFEGVYMNADVWLNGQYLSSHPYGYTGFVVDLTPAWRNGAGNVLAVRVDNSAQKNSRWYSGSGIYRHVWLTVNGPCHVAPWGVFVAVPRATSEAATVTIRTRIANDGPTPRALMLRTTLLSPTGAEVGRMETDCLVPPGGGGEWNQQAEIAHPALWTPETPQLSRAVTSLLENGREIDRTTTACGLRSLSWRADTGLLLNGVAVKLNGGCIHGDNGVLGTAAFDRAEERKIELLKAAGFNEVRTSHAPPSPALLDACDRLGMLVMEDAFDCWTKGKNPADYHLVFNDWWERDIDSMVLRDRNHPSVVFWNVGNEVPDVYSAMGAEYSPKLVARIHAVDDTRPVTNAILGWPRDDQKEYAEADWNAEDIVGTNYALSRHLQQRAQFPGRLLVGTESSPGNPADRWADVTRNVCVVGDNVWSAQDYLGEAGVGRWFYEGDPAEPLAPPKDANDKSLHPAIGHGDDRLYPWHGALCGDLDLLGNRKPMAHWRNIVWDKGEKLYLAVRQPEDDRRVVYAGWGWFPTWESWTWPGREGKPMTVEVYSRYDKIRLYLNGEKVGEAETAVPQKFRALLQLAYRPGTLKVVGLRDGREAESFELVTAQAPAALRLSADRAVLRADGEDLSFVKVEAVDRDGRIQPNADAEVAFTLTGPGSIAGLGNADLRSQASYQGSRCRLFHGEALVVIRSARQPGDLGLQASAGDLVPGALSLQTRAAR